jgi:hypothetical protein
MMGINPNSIIAFDALCAAIRLGKTCATGPREKAVRLLDYIEQVIT